MIDRESTFAEPHIVQMLKKRCVPVAIDQAYQRRQQDTEGEFYRKIAGQGPRNDFRRTTQGFYLATANGELLFYNNNRNPSKVRRLLKQHLDDFETSPVATQHVRRIESQTKDQRFNFDPPEGGLVLRVTAKVLNGYGESTNEWQEIYKHAVSRDNLWLTANEHRELTRGRVPTSMAERIARFHLVDGTRGEPDMWKQNEIRHLDFNIKGTEFIGKVHLETADGSRGYRADLLGAMEVNEGNLTKINVLALGDCWGEGRYTKGAPRGKFPLAVAFELADGSDTADRVAPQGAKGWLAGYIEN